MATGPDTRNKKARMKAERQEDLRAYLSEHNSLRQVIESVRIIENEHIDLPSEMITRRKIALDARIKLLNKVLPDLKSVEMSGDLEHKGGLTITWQK